MHQNVCYVCSHDVLSYVVHVFGNPFFSPISPDGSLTAANILSATYSIPLWTSHDSYYCLGMPHKLHEEIAKRNDGERGKDEVITVWLADHPCPSWENVVDLLRVLEREGRGRVGAAKESEEKYLTSELCCMHSVICTLNFS